MSDNFNNNEKQNWENNTNENMSEHKNVIKPKNKTNKSGKIILIVIIAVVLLMGIIQVISVCTGGTNVKVPGSKNKNVPHTTGKYVAQLYIEGTIQKENDTYNQAWLLDTIEALKQDGNNVGILLFIDSPGGTVYEADEAYLALMDYRAVKPVWAYFGSLAASGGYYIGCSAEQIAANRNSLTGSIGVIAGRSVDLTGFMNSHGIKMTTITAGKNKNMMNIDSPITEEQKQIMQDMADECYGQFVKIVSDSRDISLEKTKSLADGRIYTAKQAEDKKLIDKVCTLDEFKNDYKEYLQNSKVSFKEIKYEREKKFYEDFFKAKTNLFNQSAESNLANSIIFQDMSYPAFIYQCN